MKTNKLVRLTIFGVEQTFKNKFWIILNILMICATIIAVNFSTVKSIIKSKQVNTNEDDILNVMLSDETNSFENLLSEKESKNIKIVPYTENGVEEGNALVKISYDKNEYIKASITSSEYIKGEQYDIMEDIINSIRNDIFARENSLSPDEINIINNKVQIERIITSLDVTVYEKYSGIFFALTFIVYMLFIFISSTLASTIGMEKVSRTTEYMLTGISENSYLWYNILQTNIVVILQAALSVIYFLVASIIRSMLMNSFLGMQLTISGASMVGSFVDPILVTTILVAIVQIIFAILILSIVQAVLSSRVNNISDVSNSTVIILFFVIFATMIFPNIIPTTESVNIFLRIISMLPVVSVVAIPKLILLGQISSVGIILSVAISILALVIATIFGSKAFKKGLLSANKGNKKEERVSNVKEDDLNSSKFKASISKVAMALILYLICSNLISIIKAVFFSGLNATMDYIVSMIVWILGILPPYLYLMSSNYDKKPLKVTKKVNMNTSKKVKAIFIAFGMCWILQLFMNLIDVKEVDVTKFINLDVSSPINMVLYFAYIAILPAIFEELLFRKAIFGSLKKYGTWIAIICSSLAFGLVHQNITQGIFATLMGIILCILMQKTGSIIPSMIVHLLNNGIAVIEMFILNGKNISDFNSLDKNAMIALGIIGIIIFISIIYSIISIIYLKAKKSKFVQNEGEILKLQNPVKVIFTDFVTVMTIFIYVIISIGITQLM